MSKGLIIIPAYNEEENIAGVLEDIRRYGYDLDIVVINDGSKDHTGEVARKAGVTVIDHFYNIGYGGALQTGYKYAVAKDYDYIVQFDADGQHNPVYIRTISELMESGAYDIVIGSRFMDGVRNVSWGKVLAINFFRFIIRVSTGVALTDPTSGLQGLHREVVQYYTEMGNFPEDYPDADTLIWMLKKKYRVYEFPVDIKQRASGKSMHHGLKSVYYCLKMMVSILVVLLRFEMEKRR